MEDWSDEVIDIIKAIGRLQGERLGISPNESTQHPSCQCTGVIVELYVVFCAVFLCCLLFYYCFVLFLFYFLLVFSIYFM